MTDYLLELGILAFSLTLIGLGLTVWEFRARTGQRRADYRSPR